MNVCTVHESEVVSALLLLEVQAFVNSPEEGKVPWSGDEVLRHFCAQVEGRARTQGRAPGATAAGGGKRVWGFRRRK